MSPLPAPEPPEEELLTLFWRFICDLRAVLLLLLQCTVCLAVLYVIYVCAWALWGSTGGTP